MSRYFTDDLLRRLRNDIRFATLFAHLNWPSKQREGQLAFVCPRCGEYRSAVNPRTNLGRCFACQTNFNPIDFLMAVRRCPFVDAVEELKSLLPPEPPASLPRAPQQPPPRLPARQLFDKCPS